MRIAESCVLMVLLMSLHAPAQESKRWFDLERCAFCRHMRGHEDLLQQMTLEYHPIANGVVSVAIIPNEYKSTMDQIKRDMGAVVGKLHDGEQLSLCGFCESYGALIQAGARIEELESAAGSVSVITSQDPKVVELIQDHARRTLEAREKWLTEINRK